MTRTMGTLENVERRLEAVLGKIRCAMESEICLHEGVDGSRNRASKEAQATGEIQYTLEARIERLINADNVPLAGTPLHAGTFVEDQDVKDHIAATHGKDLVGIRLGKTRC